MNIYERTFKKLDTTKRMEDFSIPERLAIKLSLDKQVAKKIEWHADESGGEWMCPVCQERQTFNRFLMVTYCPRCGSKLNWW